MIDNCNDKFKIKPNLKYFNILHYLSPHNIYIHQQIHDMM